MIQDIHQKGLAKKLKVLMIMRLVIVTLVLVAGSLVLQVERGPFYAIIAVFYFVTLLYAVLLRFRFPVYPLAYIQIIIDIILETVVIHYAGGADSVYAFLYIPSIVAGGVIISERAAKAIAGLTSVFYGALSGLEFIDIIHPIPGAELIYKEGPWTIMFIVCFRIIIFCLVGYLSSYLSRHLYEERSALLRLRNLTDLVLNNISSGVITMDSNDKLIYINPTAQGILGKKDKDLTGIYWPTLFWEKADKDIIDRFVVQAKTHSGIEIDILRPDGKRIILGCNYSPLSDEMDRNIGGVITFRDLTLLKELELEIRQRERLSGMGELAVGIAHELRNPMASIRGSLEVLKERGSFQGENEKMVDVIFKESDRLNRIIEDFLKYAKEKRPEVRYEDLGQLINEVWLLLRHQGRWSEQAELEKRINPPRIMLHIDPEQIKQVFYNLFINALEAMPEGGKITVDLVEDPGQIVIHVKDTGIGMSKDEIGKIFQRFYSTKSYGLGMGLAITRRIVEAHQGTINLQSERGKGTVVMVTLPK